MKRSSFMRRCFIVAAIITQPFAATASIYQIELDTTPLAGQSGFMAFNLLQGTTDSPNSAVLSSFSTTSVLGAASTAGNVVGSLAGAVTLSSTAFFSEYLQAVVFGAGLTSFQLDVTEGHMLGSIPDSFSLFLLDPDRVPFTTSDPTGAAALLVFDLMPLAAPAVYASPFATATVTVIPEPSRALMLSFGVMALLVMRFLSTSHFKPFRRASAHE